MKIALITDLHMGFTPKKQKVFQRFIKNFQADMLIISGDLATNRQSQIEQTFKLIRETNKSLEVLVVFGNHDYWDGEKKFWSVEEIRKHHVALCTKYGIHYLQNNKWENDDLVIYGFDGWYGCSDPSTNDKVWMPVQNWSDLTPFQALQYYEQKALGYIMADLRVRDDCKTKMVVTHFNAVTDDVGYAHMAGNARAHELLYPEIDYLVFGHTHQKHSSVIDGCQLVNVGAHYNHSPNWGINKYWKIVEIGE